MKFGETKEFSENMNEYSLPEGMKPEDTQLLLEKANNLAKNLKGQFAITCTPLWVKVEFFNQKGINVGITHNFGSPSEMVKNIVEQALNIQGIIKKEQQGFGAESINAELEKNKVPPNKIN